jgi:hypothetical protein
LVLMRRKTERKGNHMPCPVGFRVIRLWSERVSLLVSHLLQATKALRESRGIALLYF